MAKMCVARSTRSAVSGWLRKSPMFTPSVSQTCTAYRLGGWPRTACTPAEATSMSLRLPSKRQNNPSAIGLRQILPVQTKRTLFTISRRACERADKVGLNGNKVNPTSDFADDSQPARKALQSASAIDLEKNPIPAGVGGSAHCREARADVVARKLLSVRARAWWVDVDPGSA